MGKPDWKNAPDRAQWLAQDSDGTWYWFELEPFAVGCIWNTYGASWLALPGVCNSTNWEESLEQRPSETAKLI